MSQFDRFECSEHDRRINALLMPVRSAAQLVVAIASRIGVSGFVAFAAGAALILPVQLWQNRVREHPIEEAAHAPSRRSLTCYYAHPMSSYGTPQEIEDIQLLETLGFKVINPNDPEYKSNKNMEFFRKLAAGADAVAFRALPDGKISPGVAYELKAAKRRIELPTGIEQRSESFR